jgi:hypothetical protein
LGNNDPLYCLDHPRRKHLTAAQGWITITSQLAQLQKLQMMSNLPEQNNALRTSDEHSSATAATKPPRPKSFTNFSKPLAIDSPPAASAKLVGPEELQARIKAARRSRTASQPLPEAVRRKLENSNSSDPIHPALRARSSVTPNINRGPSHKCKSREDLSIDAVIRRFSTESNRQSLSGDHLQLPGGIPPVPALPAFSLLGTHRPRQYPQTASSRSSICKKKSPLSNVSSPDGM